MHVLGGACEQSLSTKAGLVKSPIEHADFWEAVSLERYLDQDERPLFRRKAAHVHEELGFWALEHYCNLVLSHAAEHFGNLEPNWPLKSQERRSSSQNRFALHSEAGTQSFGCGEVPFFVSPKVQELIEFLKSRDAKQTSGILFVEQRVTALVLRELLSSHPVTRHLSYATFVGMSNMSKHRNKISEVIDLQDQRTTLEEFRAGERHIVIATSILEEGIDISSCNLVICFNEPKNIKSFIQRRGRARDKDSTFVLLLAQNECSGKGSKWEASEAEMLKMFQDHQRELERLEQFETCMEPTQRRFEIESTG